MIYHMYNQSRPLEPETKNKLTTGTHALLCMYLILSYRNFRSRVTIFGITVV